MVKLSQRMQKGWTLTDVPMGIFYDAFMGRNFAALPDATRTALDKDQVKTALEFEEKCRMLLFYKKSHAYLHPRKKKVDGIELLTWEVRFPTAAVGRYQDGPWANSPSQAMYLNWAKNRHAPLFVARDLGTTLGQGQGGLATLD